jgi:hypothetical protein
MSTALAPHPSSSTVSSLPVPIDKKTLTAYLAAIEDPQALELQKRLAGAYDAACRSLIGPNDVQKEGDREFKKKSAWRKLQRYFSISTDVVEITKEFIGDEFMATVTVRASAPWGQTAMAAGSCATDEEKGRRSITMADAVGTAETRATNRAVSNLIAMGEVSAEEIGERGKADRQRPEMGLEEANEYVWPWKEPAKYTGRKLGDTDEQGKPIVSTLMLIRVLDWAQAKILAGKAGRQTERLLEAVSTVLSHRDDVDAAQAEWDAEQSTKGSAETQASEGGEARSQSQSASASATPPSSAPTAPLAADEPSVAKLQEAAETAAREAREDEVASVQQLTARAYSLIGDATVALKVRDRVREELERADPLTREILETAIAALEAAQTPF